MKSSEGSSAGGVDHSKQNRLNKGVMETDSDGSVEEFEDASDFNADDDIIFTETPRQNRLSHLSEF